MRVMVIGDIVGRAGREIACALVPRFRRERSIDFVVANAENAAGVAGLTPDIGRELLDDAGIDVLTLGNHAWAKREIYPMAESEPRLLRPANYTSEAPGRGAGIFRCPAGQVAVVNVQGRIFMDPVADPFATCDGLVAALSQETSVIIVDIHAEATSEKQALAWHLDGRVSAALGTHTHVQTADERITARGTACITDLGMTGAVRSILGVTPEPVLRRFITGMPERFEAAAGPSALCGVLLEVEAVGGRALSIERLQIRA